MSQLPGLRVRVRYPQQAQVYLFLVQLITLTTEELSDGGHEARRLEQERDAAARCSACLLGPLVGFLVLIEIDALR